MEIERALETQRHALLRLLAGLFLAVGFLSNGPFEDAIPRWARSIILYILRRAEEAAQCLVKVSAWVLAENGVTVSVSVKRRSARSTDERAAEKKSNASADAACSTDRLRQRMQALRDMLEDLPRHALRLMRKRARERAAASLLVAPANFWKRDAVEIGRLVKPRRLPLPRIERPPDISRPDDIGMKPTKTPPGKPGRRHRCLFIGVSPPGCRVGIV